MQAFEPPLGWVPDLEAGVGQMSEPVPVLTDSPASGQYNVGSLNR